MVPGLKSRSRKLRQNVNGAVPLPIGARTRGSSCARRRVAPMELAEVTRRKDADEQRAQAELKKSGTPTFFQWVSTYPLKVILSILERMLHLL